MYRLFNKGMTKVAFTTSRDPSNKTRTFLKDIISVIPGSKKFTRGTQNLSFTLTKLHSEGFEVAVVINSVKGNPNFWRVFNLSSSEYEEFPFAIKLRGLTLSRDYHAKKIRQPSNLILISNIDISEERILRTIFNITEQNIDDLERNSHLTMYADYIDKDERIIFIEFLDSENNSVGPRMKIKIVSRKIETAN